MASCYILLLAVIGAAQLLQVGCGLKILSFNIENFSVKKYSKQPVVDVLLKVVREYDLVLLLEMEDTTDTVVKGLVDQLNSKRGGKGTFAGVKSHPLSKKGRSEEYTFIYRTDKVEVIDHFQYDSEVFSRPPYPLYVKATDIDLKFFLVPIHTKPRNTIAEINALPGVFQHAAKHFHTQNGVILGDLNCGCEFLSRKQYNNLKLYKDSSFHWWIEFDANTTTKKGHPCPFDRIITHEGLTERVVKGSAKPVYFDQELGLSYNMTRQVSDHYPVTFTLK